MKKRCAWVKQNNEFYVRYHDVEWCVPTQNDRKLFEFIILETAQAGLSWEIILNKRAGYKKAYKNFDPVKVAAMTKRDVTQLLKNPAIIRNRLKIEAAITNAKAFIAIQAEFGSFSNYMWSWTKGKPIVNAWKNISELPASTNLSKSMAKDLKNRGFKFLGPTIWYSHMQAVGMVNDHTIDCFRYKEIKNERT